ncbi:MAG: hypothetical protein HYW50_02825 [Candidatus Diapherotrites archaeon]|nr:hypothetical protein [Candidatus Diapherotrites archaeon]
MVSLYNKNFKKLLAVPAVFGLLFVIAIFVHPKVTPGIDLVGGTIIRASLEKETDTSKLYDSLLSHFNLIDLQVNTTSGPLGSKVLIQFSYNKELKQAQNFLAQAKQQRETNSQTAVSLALESAKYSQIVLASSDLPPQNPTAGSAIAFAEDQFNKAKESFAKRLDEFLVQELGLLENPKISKGEIGAVLGEKFYSSAITVSVMAFVLLLIVVFVFFRELIPVLAIVAASVFDVAAALALMAVFQIRPRGNGYRRHHDLHGSCRGFCNAFVFLFCTNRRHFPDCSSAFFWPCSRFNCNLVHERPNAFMVC